MTPSQPGVSVGVIVAVVVAVVVVVVIVVVIVVVFICHRRHRSVRTGRVYLSIFLFNKTSDCMVSSTDC